ncbi:hypothetical protein DUNSADRAFT_2796 [Dunaliella salina]|uniref:Tetratricopeptide repeat protein n=1 Tax=Dunaliella salina TaxID=3046 RepID=A0ABQ7FVY1_DUNSA|nr:hypothetical protein DUNSADRAFT_2796 [Dunaliella salina]|eukprot:KAF5826534.1 hypothetical protein DUNSADRAFT_2796 [Dunaliella salina]
MDQHTPEGRHEFKKPGRDNSKNWIHLFVSMGKKGGAKPKTATVEVSAEVRKQVDAHRQAATQQILKKEYSGALEAFDKAYKLLPENCAERWDLTQKKAFCYLNLRKYKDAIREAGTILEASPDSLTAKKTRVG